MARLGRCERHAAVDSGIAIGAKNIGKVGFGCFADADGGHAPIMLCGAADLGTELVAGAKAEVGNIADGGQARAGSG